MKTIVSFFIFSFLTIGVHAQETITTTEHNNKTENTLVSEKNTTTSETLQMSSTAMEEDICYSEISKVTFYEALIRQNNFDIELKESNNIALKNTEDIIKRNRNRVSYTD
ncbi:hypothetical protein U6A24_01320 [Aquimarina gracilis]|uniref:TolC family protein n=1 Tax=Aquimarina gracilis TaxID=874422 RepID=A0ABU5ZPP7_9FLAO|nr:hypothetical protein [Aquimarina gracilis]MEB3344076.1 hypothetical protein [Aquimarina gracilis]